MEHEDIMNTEVRDSERAGRRLGERAQELPVGNDGGGERGSFSPDSLTQSLSRGQQWQGAGPKRSESVALLPGSHVTNTRKTRRTRDREVDVRVARHWQPVLLTTATTRHLPLPTPPPAPQPIITLFCHLLQTRLASHQANNI